MEDHGAGAGGCATEDRATAEAGAGPAAEECRSAEGKHGAAAVPIQEVQREEQGQGQRSRRTGERAGGPERAGARKGNGREAASGAGSRIGT